MSNSHDDQARPQTSKTPERKSTRKPRSDKGVPRGQCIPRTETRGTYKGDHWEIPLTGTHGKGEVLKIDPEDYALLMEMSDTGTLTNVVRGGGGNANVHLRGRKAAAFAGYSNPKHLLPITRLLAGETHGGRAIIHINGNPFDHRRANLCTEVTAKKTRHPINWEDAEYKREKRMEVVRGVSKPGDISPSANDNGTEIHLAV
ncbi:MAG: hypothetical protein ABF979_10645 [Gluconobacter sp.]|uniref:hypothetical protein n=1 Tax=Gluconobacter sp. TaxID=1876758 RepID=UPI0039E7AAB6